MCLPTWTPHSSPPSRPTTIASFGSEPSAKWTKRKKERCAEAHSSRTLKGPHQQTPGERPPLWIRDDLVSVRFFLLGGGGTSSYYSVCIFFSLSLCSKCHELVCSTSTTEWCKRLPGRPSRLIGTGNASCLLAKNLTTTTTSGWKDEENWRNKCLYTNWSKWADSLWVGDSCSTTKKTKEVLTRNCASLNPASAIDGLMGFGGTMLSDVDFYFVKTKTTRFFLTVGTFWQIFALQF